ncbi:WbqC family protein [Kitasatospora sp. NBC_01287]|uniref:WbqC family protein n=1 Tax=Kitasatospora sp. NBC_01287 TaxID=2903573 RepID=UPI00225B461B|nr:WbqC family protein [Kitasatospora sp. NBC_01287]MCX4749183.1 WbqC family protein [Kitasatospora sp. NBC_01287]
MCAIHQPNLLPRLSTVAKIFAADVWVVLDDVQFTRRDYQHRARLGDLRSGATRWLSLPTHLPDGRATVIRQARLLDPACSRSRMEGVLREQYRASPFWPEFSDRLGPVLDLFDATNRTAEITQASTELLLAALGWHGRLVRSSDFAVRAGRTRRLVDLCRAVGAGSYLCGTGGSRYVERQEFANARIEFVPFTVPEVGVWAEARSLSTAHALMVHGPAVVRRTMEAVQPPTAGAGTAVGLSRL